MTYIAIAEFVVIVYLLIVNSLERSRQESIWDMAKTLAEINKELRERIKLMMKEK